MPVSEIQNKTGGGFTERIKIEILLVCTRGKLIMTKVKINTTLTITQKGYSAVHVNP